MNAVSRRRFVQGTAAAAILAPSFAIGKEGESANSKINIAIVGVGGRGSAQVGGCSDENIVALCDVSETQMANARKKFPKARVFKDFRKMLDEMGDEIDAVAVSTPDHTHFVATIAAMERGKHVYVEKPLVHNVWQARTLKKAAHYYNVITQMGNQGHATEGIRYVREWADAGVLGNVTDVRAWLGGPTFGGKYFTKPSSSPVKEPIPEGLDWDLWLGPQKKRDYSPEYLPRLWRSWWDFGSGLLGDWACHTIDAPFWSLGLGMPTSVETDMRWASSDQGITHRSSVRFEFPARGDKPAVSMTWYEGGLQPIVKKEWGLKELPKGGMIMTGDKQSLMTGQRPNSPKLLVSDDEWLAFRKDLPEKTFARLKGGPQAEWLAAIKGDGPMPGSNFDYAAELTEMILLGVIAQRFDTRIEYDAENMRITNNKKLNDYLKEPARRGWRYGEDVWRG